MTETWLTREVSDFEILPTGYTIFRNDRGSRGGGVLIAVSNTVPSRKLCAPSDAELIMVELGLRPSLVLGCVYLAPQCPEQVFLATMNALREEPISTDFVLVGDFNAPDIDWNTLGATSSRSSSLCDLFFDLNLLQLVVEPTHVLGNILDLVLTSAPDRFSNVTVTPVPYSDDSQEALLCRWDPG